MDTEIIKGTLLNEPLLYYTQSGKELCKAIIDNEDEGKLYIIAWEDKAEKLNTLKKNDQVLFKGYRKYNDYTKREEIIIMQIIKRYCKEDKEE